ncbi:MULTISPECIES: hypothetical protein [unclassified Mesorhizobium]|uniref:hypothetical protein n=1 Tax=unclassified Mesorhizobium TaxID=325217 RepID=UPI000FE43689|nr:MULTISPECIES: hypothetical protein [unclassified Mesorhizobium]MDG4893772.1 hypothetical protein [Mesorhizobium sp. WSM4976]RWH70216.1 MAG: hypothetical protein EOQ84_19920 [Mesorhizobium sp.]RWL23596.1 MAG: hypothetical protein EOR58_25550 [Mesorhizobium sp.]RWL25790.1 MAG: hypothetical protein EOR63_27355 [Mesorhizobium sp.]RWL34778.1 MAG: hypothetical protein EOR59_24450 [Mesorhizobium sp.]
MMRRTANIILLLMAVLFCYGLQISKPHYGDLIGPIPARGKLGDTVVGRAFEVHAEKVEFARKLKVDQFGQQKVLTTGGVWAVVSVDFAARSESTVVSTASWRGPAGLTYDQTERLSFMNGLLPVAIDPGLPRKARLIFEVRPDETSNATLLVSEKLVAALDSQAEIALGPVAVGADGLPAGTVDTLDMLQSP